MLINNDLGDESQDHGVSEVRGHGFKGEQIGHGGQNRLSTVTKGVVFRDCFTGLR